ncbi:hypothetical protein [Niallia sp. 03091]|uniref:hypothetical protein n=1 Tax=Niallia sp. 03091 TaxID=3458059 RepID=UPI004043B3A0
MHIKKMVQIHSYSLFKVLKGSLNLIALFFPAILLIGGFFILSSAFYLISTFAGLIATGISLIILACLIQYGRE